MIPTVLFVCVHNAGRSQMAAALLERIAGDGVRVLSAGTRPAEDVHPGVVEAMREAGIDLASARPRLLENEAVREADVVVTMGCGDACPVYPGTRYEDWDLPDPAGLPIQEVREIRDEIERRVRDLAASLVP
jgi:arsenate reductase